MGTITVALPVPAGTGVGGAVSTASLNIDKTVVVGGEFRGSLIIEASAGGLSFCQVATFTQPGNQRLTICADEMRVRVPGPAVVASVDVGAADAGCAFSGALDVPAGNGLGAPTNIATLGTLMTALVGDADFTGTLEVLISYDGVDYSQVFATFTRAGCKTRSAPAIFCRVRRSGVVTGTPTPQVHIGAQNDFATTTAAPTGGVLPLRAGPISGTGFPSGEIALVDPLGPNAADDGSLATPFLTLQGAIDASVLPTTSAEANQRFVVQVVPGAYDEDLTVPPARRILFNSSGGVTLGDAALAGGASTTPRNVTVQVDGSLEPAGMVPSTTFTTTEDVNGFIGTLTTFALGWTISGSVNVTDVGGVASEHALIFGKVRIEGNVDGTGDATGGSEPLIGFSSCVVQGTINYPLADLLLSNNSIYEDLVTLDQYGLIENCRFEGGMTITSVPVIPPPRGLVNTNLQGTFTGPSSSLVIDSESNRIFVENGGVLAGGATRQFRGSANSQFWGNTSIAASADTRFLQFGFGTGTAPTTPTFQVLAGSSGTAVAIIATHGSSAGNGAPVDYRLRVNGIDTALTVSLVTGAEGTASATAEVDVVAGDQIDVVAVKAASIGSGGIDVSVQILSF